MTTTAYPASPGQLIFIRTLVTERAEAVGVTDVAAFMDTIETERLTKQGASALIDLLLATPIPAKPVDPSAPVDPRGDLKFNRYAGKCALCGQQVAASEGTYDGRPGAWRTLHLPGQCPEAAPAEAPAANGEHTWASVTAILQARKPGYFAVPSVTGTNDLTFFAIKVNQGRLNPEKKGQHYFAHIVGGKDEDALKVNPAFITKCLAALDSVGEAEAGETYAKNFSCCWRCGRQLTVEISRHRGLGPECATKV